MSIENPTTQQLDRASLFDRSGKLALYLSGHTSTEIEVANMNVPAHALRPSRRWLRSAAACVLSSAVLLVMPACSDGKPSTAAIAVAVSKSLQKSVPVPLGGAMLGERDVNVTVTVLKVGNPSGDEVEGRSWPVRVRVDGSYVAEWDGSRNRFARDAEFVVRRNEFDEWQAVFRSAIP